MGWSCGKNGRQKLNWQREQMPRKWKGNGDEEDRDCIKSDLERVGEEWRKRSTNRRNWRLLTENVLR